MNSHPLIYCNGDSYSNENYHSSLKGKTYSHAVGRKLNGFVINNAVNGSCNRRIIRTSVHDLVHQRQLNPDQEIIALIGLSFEIRSEIWIDDARPQFETESNFQSNSFTNKNNWREWLINKKSLPDKLGSGFLDKYNQGRAYYYSPYAERINLMCDLLMFQSLMQQLNIQFLVFQAPKAEALESEYLLDFFKDKLNKNNFFDFEKFGFINWCFEQRFTPLDMEDRPWMSHYGPDAHQAFADQILLPRIEQL